MYELKTSAEMQIKLIREPCDGYW